MGIETDETEGIDIQDLAAQMLGLNDDDEYEEGEHEPESDEDDEPQNIHPAWQSILDSVPPEYHDQIIPTLQGWDAGVSRQFQRIHDQYEPLKRLEGYDPDEVQEAVRVYQALVTDPASTWEAIGRVYGLSPQQVSQASSSGEEDEFDINELPPALRERLERLDMYGNVLDALSQESLERQQAEQEAEEDAELDAYLEDLHDEYGDFDEEYVVGLMAAGVDGEEAVGRFQQFAEQLASQYSRGRNMPNVMPSGGGVPSAEDVDVYSLSSRNTRDLVAEILRLSHES